MFAVLIPIWEEHIMHLVIREGYVHLDWRRMFASGNPCRSPPLWIESIICEAYFETSLAVDQPAMCAGNCAEMPSAATNRSIVVLLPRSAKAAAGPADISQIPTQAQTLLLLTDVSIQAPLFSIPAKAQELEKTPYPF
jgi:hypothetical protein